MSEQIELAKRWTESSRSSMLAALASTPDDKLTWSPSSTSRSALQAVVHASHANYGLSMYMTGEPGPDMTMDQVINGSRAEEAKVKSRAEAETMINSSCDAVIKALDKVTPEILSTTPVTPFGPIPMTSLVLIPSAHMDGHKAQIDYIQTTYGDMDLHG